MNTTPTYTALLLYTPSLFHLSQNPNRPTPNPRPPPSPLPPTKPYLQSTLQPPSSLNPPLTHQTLKPPKKNRYSPTQTQRKLPKTAQMHNTKRSLLFPLPSPPLSISLTPTLASPSRPISVPTSNPIPSPSPYPRIASSPPIPSYPISSSTRLRLSLRYLVGDRGSIGLAAKVRGLFIVCVHCIVLRVVSCRLVHRRGGSCTVIRRWVYMPTCVYGWMSFLFHLCMLWAELPDVSRGRTQWVSKHPTVP